MQYYGLKSILSSTKKQIKIKNPLPSFKIINTPTKPYIEPNFEKVFYETEKPSIILISAVGATGKTTLAQQLSRETQLPILDLGKYEPVAADSLTGLLTRAYDVDNIGNVFQGLSTGTYGIIIDGIDEGRSKTTKKGFEAFMDDIERLSRGAPITNFILLGRTHILEDCWEYLNDKGVNVGLLEIKPFDRDTAKKYIDTFTEGMSSPYVDKYISARDFVLEKLQKAFSRDLDSSGDQFLSFIGYPPVLDAIVTLLKQEKNYHKLLIELKDRDVRDKEIDMLIQVCEYILQRERIEKVIPNIVNPIVGGTPPNIARQFLMNAFLPLEQLVRLVSYTLKKQISFPIVEIESFNEKYEAHLLSWFPEHPFLDGNEFRNAVFEAIALATLMSSKDQEHHQLVSKYISIHKNSYHLVYMLDAISKTREVDFTHVSALLASAMEFRSIHSVVDVHLDGPAPDEGTVSPQNSQEVEIAINLTIGEDNEDTKEFNFRTIVDGDFSIYLGSRIGCLYATLPCDLTCGDGREIEFFAPVEIQAKDIKLEAKILNIRPIQERDEGDIVMIEARLIKSKLESLITNGTPFSLSVEDGTGIVYPLYDYTTIRTRPQVDTDILQKYFRLRRILQEFRSHSRGSLAKYKHKIEHDRVLKNNVGRGVLNKLIDDNILSLKGNFYFLDPERLGERVGLSWPDLRRGLFPESMVAYLNTIET